MTQRIVGKRGETSQHGHQTLKRLSVDLNREVGPPRPVERVFKRGRRAGSRMSEPRGNLAYPEPAQAPNHRWHEDRGALVRRRVPRQAALAHRVLAPGEHLIKKDMSLI
jgi:hypothetical protein